MSQDSIPFTPVTDASTPGQVFFSGSYGTLSTNIDVGLTDINTPASSSAYLQLDGLSVTNTGASPDTLTITLQETSLFTFPGTAVSLMELTSALGGTLTPATAGDSVTFSSTVSPTGGTLGSDISTGTQSFTGTASNGTENVTLPAVEDTFVRSSGFGLESVLTLSIAPGETLNVSGTTSVTAVPEPVSSAMLSAAAAMILCRRNRRSRI